MVEVEGHSTQQVQQMVKKATNVTIKPGQAANITRRVGGGPTTNAVGEFTLIEVHMEKWKKGDSNGTYVVQVDEEEVLELTHRQTLDLLERRASTVEKKMLA